MSKKISFVIIYAWLFSLFVIGCATLFFGEKEERVSDAEKRMLSGFPDTSAESVFSGEFSTGFESYLSDGIFMRDSIANTSEAILGIFSAASYEDTMLLDGIAMADELSGKISGENAEPAETVPGISVGQSEQTEESTGNSDEPVSNNAAAINGHYGLFLRLPDGGYELLSDVSEYGIKRVAEILNAYKSFLPEDGNVFYSCVPLTSYRNVAVESGKYTGWYENLDVMFREYLVDGAYMVSSPNVLNEHLAGEHLFFQADHHWTPLAAWYLIEEMMRIQGVPVVPYDEYDYKVNLFYNYATGVPDDLELMYPLEPVNAHQMIGGREGEKAELIFYDYDNYVAYLAGDNHTWMKYDSGFSTGRNALVIGDSFSNAFLPYLLPYYDSVHRTDVRYHSDELSGGSVSALIDYYDIDDVYIILSYDNGVDSFISKQTLEYLLYDD